MAYQTVNPANNQLIKQYAAHSDADVEAALQQADALYHSAWSKGDIDRRLPVLHRLADLIDSRVDELAKIASQEMGKLIAQSRGEVKLCAQIARYYADNAKSFLAPVKYPSDIGEAWVEHHPVGVLMAVEPWNFPYYQLMRVLAPNLAAGNPIIAKHASIVPHCAETFAHLVREAGAPEGAWTNLFISQEQVAKIIADDRVQGAALTGSEKAGSVVASQAAKYIKKATLELGGNDVFVVLDDASLEKAVKTGVQARLNNAGQVCTAAKRFILHENIADQFLSQFTEAFRQVKIGDPLDESTTLGPLSSKDALQTLTRQVDEAVKNGARVHLGGKPAPREGSFFEPTILTGITR
ncbi:TPA: aldehyde dehydrogenase family protein, partial [Raoultella planticola]